MKPIENIDLKKCFEAAQVEVQADLEAQVTKQIKAQLMAVAQLRIKANNTVTEGEKLTQQLAQKSAVVAKIAGGDWSAVADTAKDRNEAAEKAQEP
jgi:hypothetical protein